MTNCLVMCKSLYDYPIVILSMAVSVTVWQAPRYEDMCQVASTLIWFYMHCYPKKFQIWLVYLSHNKAWLKERIIVIVGLPYENAELFENKVFIFKYLRTIKLDAIG